MSASPVSARPGLADRLVARQGWVVGGIVALLTLVLPLGAHALLTDDDPEVRVLETDGRLSALIVDGDARILVIDTKDREMARDALGRLYRPWEARPQVVIAPSTDDAAIGLWGVLQDLDPRQVFVAGVPGALPLWRDIEVECRRREIPLRIVPDLLTVTTPRLSVSLVGREPERDDARAVVVRRGDTNIVLAFDEQRLPVRGQVLVTAGTGQEASADLLVTGSGTPRDTPRPEIIVGRRERVRLVLGTDDVRVYGGARRGFDATPMTSSP